MQNSNFDYAMNIIDQRRQDSKQRLYLREEEISNKIPEIDELRKELSNTHIKLSKAIICSDRNKKELINKIKDDNLQIQNIIKELLIANQFPSEYLDITYFCYKCRDKGFVSGKKCICLENVIKEINSKKLSKLAPLENNTFQLFNLDYYQNPQDREKMKKILNSCMRYCETFSERSPSILMKGKTGLGKTHLSLAIANEIINKNYNVIYGSIHDLFRRIEKEHFGKISGHEDNLGHIIKSDLLILDDLGSEFENQFYTSVLYNILNSRINESKPTIISTNMNSNELEQRYDTKITSRLLSFSMLGFVGNDIRELKTKSNISNKK